MNHLMNEHEGFIATKPVEQLQPVEALALLNRWVKLKDYFHYDDRDTLYALKNRQIAKFVRAGEMQATAVIVRESQAIQGMRTQLANGGQDLNWMDYCIDINSYLSDIESEYYSLLYIMGDSSGIEVEYPEDIYTLWMQEIEPKLEAYKLAKTEYEFELKHKQPILKEYSEHCAQYQKKKQEAAFKWAQDNKVKVARSNSRKSFKKDWIETLERQGFSYADSAPINPFHSELTTPEPPVIPDRTYKITFETYVPGSLPEVESAISWCKSIVGDTFPKHLNEIDSNFLVDNLERDILKSALDEIRSEVLDIFREVLEGQLKDPEEIWDKLTDFDIDYSNAIGMEGYTNFRSYETSHREFGKWHEINFSPTGYWLIEFQSFVNPEITFHVPYDNLHKLNIKLDVGMLPQTYSTQSSFGREITVEEQRKYPLKKLLQILGWSADDFSFGLKEYSRARFSYSSDEDDDEDGYWDKNWNDDCEDQLEEDNSGARKSHFPGCPLCSVEIEPNRGRSIWISGIWSRGGA